MFRKPFSYHSLYDHMNLCIAATHGSHIQARVIKDCFDHALEVKVFGQSLDDSMLLSDIERRVHQFSRVGCDGVTKAFIEAISDNRWIQDASAVFERLKPVLAHQHRQVHR
jgi:hypothetical protein